MPPNYNVRESALFFHKLVDAVNEARSKYPEAWVTIGADWNGRDLQPLLQAFPDLSKIATPPTRADATLDIVVSNYINHLQEVRVNHALQPDDSLGNSAADSDHSIVKIQALLPRPKAFVWEVYEYMKVTKEGSDRLVGLLNNMDWSPVEDLSLIHI